jgi:hypothetical protein
MGDSTVRVSARVPAPDQAPKWQIGGFCHSFVGHWPDFALNQICKLQTMYVQYATKYNFMTVVELRQ